MVPYPNHRKSPYRHKVRSHTRNGNPVSSYDRGNGRPPRQQKIVKSNKNGFDSYSVVIEYTDGSGEQLNVKSKDYGPAINKGLTRRGLLGDVEILNIKGVE